MSKVLNDVASHRKLCGRVEMESKFVRVRILAEIISIDLLVGSRTTD